MNRRITLTFILALVFATANAQFKQDKKDVNKEKETTIKVTLDGGFVTSYQMLNHSNDADDLAPLANGFKNAAGNLGITIQLYDGISTYINTYLSSEHHTEVWMREGYMVIDKLTMFNSEALNNIMKHVRIKAGQMEVNYGDWHLRRSDNGYAKNNPLVGNYIMDANTTEIGAEVYVTLTKDLEFMAALSGGTTKGDLKEGHGTAFYSKLAYDKTFENDFRFRLSGSIYTVDHSGNGPGSWPNFVGTKNYVYSGNRSGGRYGGLFGAETDAGQILPGTSQNIFAYQINPYFQLKGLEFFGIIEQVKDKDNNGSDVDGIEEAWTQVGGELVYSFGAKRNFYMAGRYAKVKQTEGNMEGANIDRLQLGLGYNLTENVKLKAEYVTQKYNDFTYPGFGTNFVGAGFDGLVIEASVSF